MQKKLYFWSLFFSQFVRVHSVYGFIVSVVLSLLLWWYSPYKNVPLLFLLVITIILTLIIFSLASALVVALKYQSQIPRIINVKPIRGKEIFLLENSKLFSHGIIVSFYYTDEYNFEQLICIGIVDNIQENGLIQVSIDFEVDWHQDIISKLKNKDKNIIEKVTVKPTVPVQYYELRGDL